MVGPAAYPSFSSDASRLAFSRRIDETDRCGSTICWDVYVQDLATGLNSLASARPDGSPGNGSSFCPTLTPDGTQVVYLTKAGDLGAPDANTFDDIYLATSVPPASEG